MRELNFKIEIPRNIWMRLAIVIAIVGAATLVDVYFENNPENAKEMQSETADNPSGPTSTFFVNQSNSLNAKTSMQKDTGRKLQVKSHDKFIQKYHQLRNNQVLKAEVQSESTPLILSYHYLRFKNYFFTFPDDEPLVS